MKKKGNHNRDGYLTRVEFLEAEERLRDDFHRGLQELREDFGKRFEAMDKRFEAMDIRFEAQKDWVGVVVGGFQNRAGKSLEDTVAGAMQLALGMYDIRPEHLKLRQKLLDKAGKVGPAGREYEIDLLIKNGESYVFEVKSVVDKEQLFRFDDKASLAIEEWKLKRAKKVLVTLAKDPWLLGECERMGIRLV